MEERKEGNKKEIKREEKKQPRRVEDLLFRHGAPAGSRYVHRLFRLVGGLTALIDLMNVLSG